MATRNSPRSEAARKTEFKNVKTGASYSLTKASEIAPTGESLQSICSICNEPEVYDFLFRSGLEGQPYSIEKAKSFLEWASNGWRESTHFVFVIADQKNSVCGVADIKSNSLARAEIGYWASKQHSGIMTPAVGVMSEVATRMGFQNLFAFVKRANTRSIAVLERNHFIKESIEDLNKEEVRLRFQRKLQTCASS